MTTQNLVTELKNKATQDKVFNDVCVVFATRDRARFTVTVGGLMQRMKKDGFTYGPSELQPVLRFLASLGLGHLQMSAGKVIALTDVKTTLQSIGSVALGQTTALAKFRQRHKFHAIPVKSITAPAAKAIAAAVLPKKTLKLNLAPVEKTAISEGVKAASMTLLVKFKGADLAIPVPMGLASRDVAALIEQFKHTA